VNAAAALAGYAACDAKAEVERESYLSAFCFGADFACRNDGWRVDVRGFDGPSWAPWLWFDIDREGDIEAATRDARKLAAHLADRYGLDDDLLVFFSGSKGFHLGLPTALWRPAASVAFHRVARQFAETAAARCGVAIDSVYDKVRAFRAPNSRHPKTGLHKRRLSLDELLHLKPAAILQRATEPEPFALPKSPSAHKQAQADWLAAEAAVASREQALRERRAAGPRRLNRRTLEFIREGASEGDRHRLLFSAAANLAELDCPPALAHELLTEAALDSGLAPKDVRRQIECGLAKGAAKTSPQEGRQSPQAALHDSQAANAQAAESGERAGSQGRSCQQTTGATISTE